jgi:hypothetical protein
VFVFTAVAGFQVGPRVSSPFAGDWTATSLGAWYAGRSRSPFGEDLQQLARGGYLADGTTTLFLLHNNGYYNWRLTFVNATFNRNSGPTIGTTFRLNRIPAGGKSIGPKSLTAAVNALEQTVDASPVPIRIVVRDPQLADALRARQVRATVVTLDEG